MTKGENYTTLMSHQVGLPPEIDVDELNQYIHEWTREARRSWTLWIGFPSAVLAGILGLVLWLVGLAWYWAGLAVLVGVPLAYYLLFFAYTVYTIRKRIWFICPRCRNPITITASVPSSAWECPNCQFPLFRHWRARRYGAIASASDVGDLINEAGEAHALGQRAYRLLDLRQPHEASELLERAVRLRPGDPGLHSELSLARLKLGDLPGALAEIDEAIRLDESSAKFHCNRAVVLLRMERFAEAEGSARRALHLDLHYRSAREILSALKGRHENEA